jgi:starch synthase
VRKTGGLKDTVMILEITAAELSWSICWRHLLFYQRAINLYKDKRAFVQYRNEYRSFLGKTCQEYIEVYNLIINKIWKLRKNVQLF